MGEIFREREELRRRVSLFSRHVPIIGEVDLMVRRPTANRVTGKRSIVGSIPTLSAKKKKSKELKKIVRTTNQLQSFSRFFNQFLLAPVVQWLKTSDFHSEDAGSIPVGRSQKEKQTSQAAPVVQWLKTFDCHSEDAGSIPVGRSQKDQLFSNHLPASLEKLAYSLVLDTRVGGSNPSRGTFLRVGEEDISTVS